MPRKKKVTHYVFNEEEYTAYKWCINNDILIAPFALSDTRWYIDIVNKGVQHRSPETYDHKNLYKTIFNFYIYYYEKYSNKK